MRLFCPLPPDPGSVFGMSSVPSSRGTTKADVSRGSLRPHEETVCRCGETLCQQSEPGATEAGGSDAAFRVSAAEQEGVEIKTERRIQSNECRSVASRLQLVVMTLTSSSHVDRAHLSWGTLASDRSLPGFSLQIMLWPHSNKCDFLCFGRL